MQTANTMMMSSQFALVMLDPMSVEATMPGMRPRVESVRKLTSLMRESGTM